MRTDYKEIVAYAKKAQSMVYGNSRTDGGAIVTIVDNVLKQFKIKSGEYKELLKHLLAYKTGIGDAWAGSSSLTILNYNQFADWTGDPENILEITKRLKTPINGIIALFELNNKKFTKKQIVELLKEHNVTGSDKREHEVQSDWAMLQNIKPSYLTDFAGQYIKEMDIDYNATHYTSAHSINLIVDCLKCGTPRQIQEHVQYFKDNLTNENSNNHIELRFLVSKKLWEYTITTGINNIEDADVLAAAHKLNVFSNYETKEILETTYQNQDIGIFDYLVSKHEKCKSLSLESNQFVEYWNKRTERLDTEDFNILHPIMESNKYTSKNENVKYAYDDAFICSSFMKFYQKYPNVVIHNMKSWQYQKVDDNNNITDTTLTPYILLVMFRHLDTINITERKDFNNYFPGFSTKEGRSKLIDTYFPKLKTIIMQPDLFDTSCLLQAYWNSLHDKSTALDNLEELPVFDF